jgi:hypothetical protein
MNNSVNAPMYWAGVPANKSLVLPDWPVNTTAALIAQHKYHIFALDITLAGVRNGNRFIWSDAAQPGAIPQFWTASATNEAGSGQLSDTPNNITAARSLRDTFIIYKANSAYTVDYVKGNDKFVTKLLWSRAGALSPRAVDEIGGRHVVVTEGDIVINDGYNQPVSIAEGLVRRFLFDQISTSTYEALQVLHDYVNNDVWIMFPETGATFCTLALVYNIASQAWGVVELQDVAYAAMGIVDDSSAAVTWDADGGTWDSDTTAWNESDLTAAIERMTQAQPNTTKIQIFNTADLSVVNSLMAKYGITFGEPERIKFVRQVHLRGRGFGTFYVRVGSQMFPDQVTTWANEQTITDPGQPVPIFTQGRYISIEVRAADNAQWDFTGFDWEVEMRGYY